MSRKLFFSYARRDGLLRDELAKHLRLLERENKIETWHDRDIDAGDEWKTVIDEHLETADIILLLVSPDFLSSEYIYEKEMKRAMERHEAGDARVIPVIVRPVESLGEQLSKLQALPKDAKPITTWANQDEAFANVAIEIRKIVSTPNPQKTRSSMMV
jgi:hypothetical protein